MTLSLHTADDPWQLSELFSLMASPRMFKDNFNTEMCSEMSVGGAACTEGAGSLLQVFLFQYTDVHGEFPGSGWAEG